MQWNRLINLCTDETKKAVKVLIAKDLGNLVGELGYRLTERSEQREVKITEVKKKGGRANPIELPEVFGRKFKSVVKMAEYFQVKPGRIYYWLDRGEDLELKLKEKGVLPKKIQEETKTLIRTSDEEGNKVYKL